MLALRASATGSGRLRGGSTFEEHAATDGEGSGGASGFANEEEDSADESDLEVRRCMADATQSPSSGAAPAATQALGHFGWLTK